MRGAIDTIAFLVRITSLNSIDPCVTPQFQFSLVEALYARGFTQLEQIQNLTRDQFVAALVESVACRHAADIYNQATGSNAVQPSTSATGADSFAPVNADGSLVNYLPPPNLSPFGPAAYLHDLLTLPLGATTLGQLVAARRGLL